MTDMGLVKDSTITKSRIAHTQYITIPASIVQDSQYPFGDAGKIKVTVEPEQKYIIISLEEVALKYTKYGVLLFKKGSADLPAEFEVVHS